jgi:hypothetical protein
MHLHVTQADNPRGIGINKYSIYEDGYNYVEIDQEGFRSNKSMHILSTKGVDCNNHSACT